MYHSITFGDKNTYDDWHLIPTSRPYFVPPDVKTKILQIPGGSRRLDYTDTLLGRPAFGNRQGSIEFAVEQDESFNWDIIYEEIRQYLHGRVCKAVLEDDPLYYYEGRFSLSSRKSDKYYSTIVIDYNVYPFKRDLHPPDGSLPWDDIVFDPSMTLRETMGIRVDSIFCLEIPGTYESTVPSFECIGSFDCYVTTTPHRFKTADEFQSFCKSEENDIEMQFHVSDGKWVVKNFIIGEDAKNLIVLGSGEFSVNYRGGSL